MNDIAFGDFLYEKLYAMVTSASGGSVQEIHPNF